MENKIDEAFAA